MADPRQISVNNRINPRENTKFKARTQSFMDISFSMFKHPMDQDIGKKTDSAAIKQSVDALLKTNHFERPMQPHIGSDIKKLLFEPMDAITEKLLEDSVRATLTSLEERIDLQDVIVTPQVDQNRYIVRVVFSIKGGSEAEEVDLMLSRASIKTGDAGNRAYWSSTG